MVDSENITLRDRDKITQIRDWVDHPVTISFMANIASVIENNDISCHASLKKGDFSEAAYWSASMEALNEVLKLPEEMIEDLREE